MTRRGVWWRCWRICPARGRWGQEKQVGKLGQGGTNDALDNAPDFQELFGNEHVGGDTGVETGVTLPQRRHAAGRRGASSGGALGTARWRPAGWGADACSDSGACASSRTGACTGSSPSTSRQRPADTDALAESAVHCVDKRPCDGEAVAEAVSRKRLECALQVFLY